MTEEKARHILEYPAPSLLEPSVPVENFDDELVDFCWNLKRFFGYMAKRFGPRNIVGLAAPQVGKNIRVFIAFENVYINPEIVWTPKVGTATITEGCLSLPLNRYWQIQRPYGLTLKWQDVKGDEHRDSFNGMNARVIFHEIDHLDGKLCCGEDYPVANDTK